MVGRRVRHDPAQPNSPYVKSKTIAERAAWEFAGNHPGGPQLTVVNPVGIFGPVLGPNLSSSVQIVKALLEGKPRVLPKASFAVVDVRDVVDLHMRAMLIPGAAGERFLASAGPPMTLPEIAATLRSRLGARASRVPKHEIPDWAVRIAARIAPGLETIADLLGDPKQISTAKATELRWPARTSSGSGGISMSGDHVWPVGCGPRRRKSAVARATARPLWVATVSIRRSRFPSRRMRASNSTGASAIGRGMSTVSRAGCICGSSTRRSAAHPRIPPTTWPLTKSPQPPFAIGLGMNRSPSREKSADEPKG